MSTTRIRPLAPLHRVILGMLMTLSVFLLERRLRKELARRRSATGQG